MSMNTHMKILEGLTAEESAKMLRACDAVWSAIGDDVLASDSQISNVRVIWTILDCSFIEMYGEVEKPLLVKFRNIHSEKRCAWLKANRRYN